MTIIIEVSCSKDPPKFIKALIKKKLHKAIIYLLHHDILITDKNCFLSIYFTDSQETLRLNQTFRDKDKIADILSFPNIDDNNPDEKHLGDLVFACDTIEHDAHTKHISLEHHYIHLACHGLLHLCGLHHDNDRAHNTMIKTEIALLKNLGYMSPYKFCTTDNSETVNE